MKRFFVLLYLSALIACSGTKIAATNQPPVVIEGDNLFFDGQTSANIFYRYLSDIVLLSSELRLGKKLAICIEEPTVFRLGYSYFIAYPKEHIRISANENGDLIFTSNGGTQRNQEHEFLRVFQNLNSLILPRFPVRTQEYPIDSILGFEQKFNASMPAYIRQVNSLVDSLSVVYAISDTYKHIIQKFLKTHIYYPRKGFLSVYSKELKESNLYESKIKEFKFLYDDISDVQEIHIEAADFLEDIAAVILPKKLRAIKTEDDLRQAMEYIVSSFKNQSRNFLLTKFFYTALIKRVPISKSTQRYYFKNCTEERYQTVIGKLIAENRSLARQARFKNDNRLVSFSDGQTSTLDEIIAQHKGKYVVIDIWASWCLPCLEQHESLVQLDEKLSDNDVIFLHLSIDRELVKWRLKHASFELAPRFSYVFEDVTQSSFLSRYQIEAIPRYLLLDRNGKMLSSDAPTPLSGELEKLMLLYLAK